MLRVLEVDSCSGERDAWQRLSALTPLLPATSLLPALLRAPAPLVRQGEPVPEALLDDPCSAVAEAALRQLVASGSVKVGAVLAERLRRGHDVAQTADLIRCAGRLDAPALLLAQHLDQGGPRAIAEALIEWATPAVRPMLRRALAGDVHTATSAALALCRYARRTLAIAAGVCAERRAVPILRGWMREKDRKLAACAALGLALLEPDQVPPDALRPARLQVATFDLEALAVVSGLRAAGRLRLPARIRAQCRGWAQGLAPGVEEAVRCCRGTGRSLGWASGLSLWVRDLRGEAEDLLRG